MVAGVRFLTEVERHALEEIKRRVSALFAVREFVLFGSKARGDFGPDSDVDLLIVTHQTLDGAQSFGIADAVTDVNLEYGTEFSGICVSAAMWDSQRVQALSIHRAVEAEGVPV